VKILGINSVRVRKKLREIVEIAMVYAFFLSLRRHKWLV
jgi:hypothetical protein